MVEQGHRPTEIEAPHVSHETYARMNALIKHTKISMFVKVGNRRCRMVEISPGLRSGYMVVLLDDLEFTAVELPTNVPMYLYLGNGPLFIEGVL